MAPFSQELEPPRYPGRFINVAEAKLGISRSTIYRLVKGGLDLVKIGKRSSGIAADSINAMIERNKAAR